jgi:hypothetical protein
MKSEVVANASFRSADRGSWVNVTLRGAVAGQGGLTCATLAAYVGAPTMMGRASLFDVWLHGARGSDKSEMGRCYFSMT